MTSGVRLPLALCNVSVADVPLNQVIPAAAAARFDAVSLYGPAVRRSIDRDGIGPAELARMLRDHGLVVTDVEAVGDWLGPPPRDLPRWLDPGFDEHGFLDLAATVGAGTLVATHFGPPAPLDEAARQFAGLCDRAADRGLTVALEYPAMATIADVATAWAVIKGAGRADAGLVHDVWHHARSPSGDAELAAVPAERIRSVQLADASREPVGPPMEDVRHRRLLGTGDLRPAAQLRALVERGVRCPVGIEVFTAFDRRPARERIQELYDNLRAAVLEAGLDA